MDDAPMSFAPYEGTEPFIFVSYSHRDTETVLPILESMCQQGYRIWYDEGIPWSVKWMNAIYDHLKQSAVCLVFHSSSSVKSIHCQAEISTMLSQGKPIVSVYLEDVQMEDGLGMYLGQFQSVKFYQFQSIDEFMSRLNTQDVFIPCKGASQEEILWVDDRPELTVGARKALEQHGISLTLALNTKQALRHLKTYKFSLIVSDMGRKEGPQEGYVLLEEVRKFNKTIPFIIYSSFRSEEHIKETLLRGGQGNTNDPYELVGLVLENLSK